MCVLSGEHQTGSSHRRALMRLPDIYLEEKQTLPSMLLDSPKFGVKHFKNTISACLFICSEEDRRRTPQRENQSVPDVGHSEANEI